VPIRTEGDGSQKESKEQVKGESARSVFREFFFSPLPYAAQEGKALRALLPGATLLTKRQATKAALIQVRNPFFSTSRHTVSSSTI
jgi:hypothetical protein